MLKLYFRVIFVRVKSMLFKCIFSWSNGVTTKHEDTLKWQERSLSSGLRNVYTLTCVLNRALVCTLTKW